MPLTGIGYFILEFENKVTAISQLNSMNINKQISFNNPIVYPVKFYLKQPKTIIFPFIATKIKFNVKMVIV